MPIRIPDPDAFSDTREWARNIVRTLQAELSGILDNQVTFKRHADQRTTETDISAAGTALAGATALSADFNVIGTSGTAENGVTLPDASKGREIWVRNEGSVSISIYPNGTAQQINTLGTGSALSLGTAAGVTLRCPIANQWYTGT